VLAIFNYLIIVGVSIDFLAVGGQYVMFSGPGRRVRLRPADYGVPAHLTCRRHAPHGLAQEDCGTAKIMDDLIELISGLHRIGRQGQKIRRDRLTVPIHHLLIALPKLIHRGKGSRQGPFTHAAQSALRLSAQELLSTKPALLLILRKRHARSFLVAFRLHSTTGLFWTDSTG
jgi:hypothetical protein